MRLRALLIAVSLMPPTTCIPQVDFDQARVPMVELVGPWRFHPGDDARWREPEFDDSGWALIKADKTWNEQGFQRLTGVAWYRIRLAIPKEHGTLEFLLDDVNGSCEIYANGQRLGGVGGMPPHPWEPTSTRSVYPIPNSLLTQNSSLEIALRVWNWPIHGGEPGGGFTEVPRVGEVGAIQQWLELEKDREFRRLGGLITELFGSFLIGLASLALYALRRREREYLWFGLSLLMWGANHVGSLVGASQPVHLVTLSVWIALTYGLRILFELQFYVVFLGQKRRWLYRTAFLVLVIESALLAMVNVTGDGPVVGFLFVMAIIVADSCEIGMLTIGAFRGIRDAYIPAVALLMQAGLHSASIFLYLLPPWAWSRAVLAFLQRGLEWPFHLNYGEAATDLGALAILVILVRRFARSRQNEERLQAEMEAAREVQKVLIPTAMPQISGLEMDSIYLPALQVGGDFFQIIPTKAGGALIVIGDVSGKGMPAAMTVSLLVGTVRTLAQFMDKPGEILRAMNIRMLARSGGGFTTCLVLRIDADGTMKIANAGHIAPFLNGEELTLENGLPLGLTADTMYTESTFHLDLGEQLTMMTDGVVEARCESDELYGFERTAAIARSKAETIARTAQQFGQEDDITVLTVTRLRTERSQTVQAPTSALSADLA